MKFKFINGIIIGTIVGITLSVFGIYIIGNLYISNLEKNNFSDSAVLNNNELISIYLEKDGDYVYSLSSVFPSSGYTFNEEKSYCINESNLSYNEITNTVSVNTNGSENCYLYFDNITLSNQILIDNGGIDYIENKTSPNFGTLASTDEGMFATVDNDGKSYYFRGDIEYNYVLFADMLWRIIRIDGFGNVKMVLYNEDSNVKSYSSAGSSVFKNTFTASDLNYETSDAKVIVDEWYETNLESNYQQYLAKTDYCVDLYTPVGTTYYAPFVRLVGYSWDVTKASPSLLCDTSLSGVDEYQYYVGLLTADEVAFAGANYNIINLDYFLYTDHYVWTMSPFQYYLSESSAFYISKSGTLSAATLNKGLSIFPVITISSDVEFLDGNGSFSEPYEIVES